MRPLSYILIIILLAVLPASGERKGLVPPVKVTIKKDGEKYRLMRNGLPYYIKGAGGCDYYDRLKDCGGNSVRLWTTKGAKKYLDQAHKLGLTVTLGLDMALERHGFDYSNKEAVRAQFERLKKEVLAYKDHPALLMWGVGNELDQFAVNYNVWNAVNELAAFIHKVDPDHPTTTMMAGVPAMHIQELVKRAPNIDVLSINAFMDLPYIRSKITDAGWSGPYLVTEWGASGYWETPLTSWGAFIEETSTEKETVCRERYEKTIVANSDRCLGSYVFYWGYKQARTHTLLSLYLESGEKISVIDMLREQWTGKFPANKAPHIEPLEIEGKKATDNIILRSGSVYKAFTAATDPEKDKLSYRWQIFYESKEKKEGGDKENKPAMVQGLITADKGKEVEFKAPAQEGAYRLFVDVFDGHKNAATANIPFYVKH